MIFSSCIWLLLFSLAANLFCWLEPIIIQEQGDRMPFPNGNHGKNFPTIFLVSICSCSRNFVISLFCCSRLGKKHVQAQNLESSRPVWQKGNVSKIMKSLTWSSTSSTLTCYFLYFSLMSFGLFIQRQPKPPGSPEASASERSWWWIGFLPVKFWRNDGNWTTPSYYVYCISNLY